MRGHTAKKLRREAERVSGESLKDEVTYQIAEAGLKTMFRATGARGYYNYLKRKYDRDIPFRHFWQRRSA